VDAPLDVSRNVLIGGVGGLEVCPIVRVSLYSYVEGTTFNTFIYISVLSDNQYYIITPTPPPQSRPLVCVLHVAVCVLSFEHLSWLLVMCFFL
jgi:hypothetical protein